MKILLLNPPGKRPYIRDYYCSKVSRTNYLFQPVDLLLLSGRLAEHFDVAVMDAMADRVSPGDCLARIGDLEPDVIISMIGAVSLPEDCAFLERAKMPSRRIIVTGDVVLGDIGEWLRENRFIDAALLDFTSDDIIPFIQGDSSPRRSIVTRRGDSPPFPLEEEKPAEFVIPVPRHDLFTSRNYRFPFARHREFTTVLTDYGCPYHCSFCVMNTLRYKSRPVDNVLDELRFIKKIGKKDIYFIDQTFGADSARSLELCARMVEERFDFGWTCFSRADLITDEFLTSVQAAGCNAIIIGAETASSEMLKKYSKGCTKEQIQEAFRMCRARKIRTIATFILGLPEETEETAMETIRFSQELDCDYASFSIAVPRVRTALRTQAVRKGLASPDIMEMDQSGASIAMSSCQLSKVQLGSLMKKAITGFYMRPAYLWRRARGISNLHELREHLYEGRNLIGSIFRK